VTLKPLFGVIVVASLMAFALISSLTLFSDVPRAAGGVVFVVDTEADNLVGGDGDCTLREAVKAARENIIRADCGPAAGSSSTLDTINLPGAPIMGNTYGITMGGIGADEGDFNLGGGPLLIQRTGPGGSISVVDANDLDRAFYIQAGGVVTMNGFIITDGASPFAGNGGAILNDGILTLDGMRVSASEADASSGGHRQQPLADSRELDDHRERRPWRGGISSQGTLSSIVDSAITGNVAESLGGGESLRSLRPGL
jgi:CSLREA domain-containing protein